MANNYGVYMLGLLAAVGVIGLIMTSSDQGSPGLGMAAYSVARPMGGKAPSTATTSASTGARTLISTTTAQTTTAGQRTTAATSTPTQTTTPTPGYCPFYTGQPCTKDPPSPPCVMKCCNGRYRSGLAKC